MVRKLIAVPPSDPSLLATQAPPATRIQGKRVLTRHPRIRAVLQELQLRQRGVCAVIGGGGRKGQRALLLLLLTIGHLEPRLPALTKAVMG